MATIRQTIHGTWQVQIRRKGYPTQTRTFDKKLDGEVWARDVERDMDRLEELAYEDECYASGIDPNLGDKLKGKKPFDRHKFDNKK